MAIISNKPNMNYGIWGSNGNVTVPTSEKVEQGHIVEKPKAEIVNWIENRQDSFLQYLNQRGIPTWDSTTEYAQGAYVVKSGTLYRALSQNQDKDPTSNTAIWTVAFATYADYLTLYTDVETIKSTEGYLPLYVSKANPVMTGECLGVSYTNSTGVSGLTFSGTSPQIEKDGEVVGTFTGTESDDDVVTFKDLRSYLQFYNVGDLYLTTLATNPYDILGYGTWERYAEGKALVGISSPSSTNPSWTKFAGSTYGSYTHTLTQSEIPSHKHTTQLGDAVTSGETSTISSGGGLIGLYDTQSMQDSGGGDQPHNNVQPSIIVYVWRRIE